MSGNVLAGQGVFKKVHLSERKKALQDVIRLQVELTFKTEKEEFGQFKILSMDDQQRGVCRFIAGGWKDSAAYDVVVNFTLEEEKYFFRSMMGKNNLGDVIINLEADVFQLQRRKNARFDIPEGYEAVAKIADLNGQELKVDAPIKDMSAGGCKIFFPQLTPEIKMNDKLTVALHLGKRRPMTFTCDVRYVGRANSGQMLGLQFMDRDHFLENRLLVMMMDLQREFYLKFGAG